MVTTKDAMGFCCARDSVKIAFTMPAAQFDELKQWAIKEDKSLAAKIREYVEIGLQVDRDLEEDGAAEEREAVCIVDISRAPILQEHLAKLTKEPR